MDKGEFKVDDVERAIGGFIESLTFPYGLHRCAQRCEANTDCIRFDYSPLEGAAEYCILWAFHYCKGPNSPFQPNLDSGTTIENRHFGFIKQSKFYIYIFVTELLSEPISRHLIVFADLLPTTLRCQMLSNCLK